MKVQKLLVCLLGAGMLFASCSEENDVTTQVITFEGAYWNSLIDKPQYNGPLLYGSNASNYQWVDKMTQLKGGMTNAWGGQYGYAEGGTAISDYKSDLKEHNTYDYQLEVPSSNGSKNFAVVYCTAKLEFNDGKSHVIRSMQVSPTTYVKNVALYGSSYAKALNGKDDFLTLHIKANTGKTMDVDFVRGGKLYDTWRTINLSELGAVKSMEFTMSGSDSSEFGLNTPAYFALDNMVIEK